MPSENTILNLFRRSRNPNPLHLGRQPFATGSTPGQQVYLYLHRSRQLRTAGASPRLDNRRRRKPPTNPLLPLRPNQHPEGDNGHPRQSLMVRRIHHLGASERRNQSNG